MELGKPSSWSIGKVFGLLAVVLLLLGPFLPYHTWENRSTGELDSIPYIHGVFIDELSFIPFLSVIFIAILLFPEFPFHFEKNTRYGKINHFFLIIWGGSFFVYYIIQDLQFSASNSEWFGYPGYGYWIIIMGFICCGLAGFFERVYPTLTIYSFLHGIPTKKGTELKHEPSPEIPPQNRIEVDHPLPQNKIENAQPLPQIKEKEIPFKARETSEPAPEVSKVEPREVEPPENELTVEEIRNLRRWSKHIDEHNQAYEQCMKCQNYVFMKAKETQGAFNFTCPECNTSFTLSK